MIKWENNAFTLPNGKREYAASDLAKLHMFGGRNIKRWVPRAIINILRNNYHASYAEYGNFAVPCPKGLKYLPYQIAGIEYMFHRDKVLLADEQGLGKTVQVCGLINKIESVPSERPKILIICPASLKYNWKNELSKWCIYPKIIDIVQGSKHQFIDAQITIINYEMCHKLKEQLGREYDLVILDEAHYLKNHTSKRTQAILHPVEGIATKARRVIAVTGTPVSNRPIELWAMVVSIFKKYWPKELRSYRAYGEYFCAGYDEQVRVYDAKKGYTRYIKEFNVRGASALPTLNSLLRERFMLRRLKSNVLPQLPDKTYQVIDIANSQLRGGLFGQLIRKENEYAEEAVKAIQTGQRLPPMEEMASVRKELAMLKLPFATEFIRNVALSGEKVIVFCYHTDVAKGLREALQEFGVSMIIGQTKASKRSEEVDNFQNGDNKIFIGNLVAAGTGLTLTASSSVVFVESSWVPGENEQAVDRAHRISQSKKVIASFLTWFGSMDAQILRTSIKKQKNINRIVK